MRADAGLRFLAVLTMTDSLRPPGGTADLLIGQPSFTPPTTRLRPCLAPVGADQPQQHPLAQAAIGDDDVAGPARCG